MKEEDFGEVIAHLEGEISVGLYEGENYIGRYPWYGRNDKDADEGPYIVLAESAVSPQHAIIEVRRAEGDALVRCCNGQTIVNEYECRPRISHQLPVGGTVKFTKIEFVLRWGPPPLTGVQLSPKNTLDQVADEPLRLGDTVHIDDADEIHSTLPQTNSDPPSLVNECNKECLKEASASQQEVLPVSSQAQEEDHCTKDESIFPGETWREGTSIAVVTAARTAAAIDLLPPSPPKSRSKPRKAIDADDNIFNQETQEPSQIVYALTSAEKKDSTKKKRSSSQSLIDDSVPPRANGATNEKAYEKKARLEPKAESAKLALTKREISTDSCRSSKRRRKRVVPHILVTGLVNQRDRDDVGRLITAFGAVETTRANDATHLITGDRLKRTPKFLAAVSFVDYVLTFSWLRASARAGRTVNESEYMIKDEEAERNWGFSLSKSLSMKTKVLENYMVGLAPGLRDFTKLPKDTELDEIVQAAGGIFIHDIRSESKTAPNGLLVLCTMERIHAGLEDHSTTTTRRRSATKKLSTKKRASNATPEKVDKCDAASALQAIRSLPRDRLAGVLEPLTFWRIILRKHLDLNSDVFPPHAVSPISKHHDDSQ